MNKKAGRKVEVTVNFVDATITDLVNDLVLHRQQELAKAIDEWTRRCGANRSFPFQFFSCTETRRQLKREIGRSLPEGMEVEDLGADLVIFLQRRLESGQIDLCNHPPLCPKPLEDSNKFALAKALLEACLVKAPAVLCGKLAAAASDDSEQSAAASRSSKTEIYDAISQAVESKGKATRRQSGGVPSDSAESSFAAKISKALPRRLSWSQFYLYLHPVPPQPRLAETTDEGSSRPATLEHLRGLFRRPRKLRRGRYTRLPGVFPLVRSNPDNCQLVIGRSNQQEDCDRMAPAGYPMFLSEELRNRHTLAVGQTGSGKTTKLILPILDADIADREKTVVILDAKGELVGPVAEMTRRYRNEEPMYVDFRDPQRSLGWNPLSGVRTKGEARELALRICMSSEDGRSSGDSRFFLYSSVDLLTGIIVALHADPDCKPTLAYALAIADLGVKEFESFAARHSIPELKRFASYIGTASHNAETVLADLRMRLGLWRDERVCATTSTHELDFALLAKRPSVLIIHIDEQDVDLLKPLTNAFMTSLFGAFLSESNLQPDKSLPIAVSVIIEEFASAVGRILELERRLNTIRQRRISLTASIQSLSQIDLEYGSASRPLLAGFSTKIYFPNLVQEDAEYVSRCSGAMTIVKGETTVQTERATAYGGEDDVPLSKTTTRLARRVLFTPDEVTSAAPGHRKLGRAITFEFPDLTMFQAFLTPVYLFPTFRKHLALANKQTAAVPLRTESLSFELPHPPVQAAVPGNISLTDTTTWTDEEVCKRLEHVKRQVAYADAAETSAGKWWTAFEAENKHRPRLILRLAEELAGRSATIQEFFLAYVYSNTDNIQANLHFLDYRRLKTQEEEKKKAAAQAAKRASSSVDVEKEIDELLAELEDVHAPGNDPSEPQDAPAKNCSNRRRRRRRNKKSSPNRNQRTGAGMGTQFPLPPQKAVGDDDLTHGGESADDSPDIEPQKKVAKNS